MTIITPQVLADHTALGEQIETRLHQIASTVDQIRTGVAGWEWGLPDDWDQYGDRISVDYSKYRCGCCGPDHHTVEFPLSYLEPGIDWEAAERGDTAAKAAARQVVQEAEARAAAEAREAAERAELARLAEKYR